MSFLSIGRNKIVGKIQRKDIDPDAITVIRRLNHAGFTAYLVGGSVRDLLLGRIPKDFDIVTDAKPNQIRRLFRNSFLIGRRFRLALIVFGDKQIETSTFRRIPPEDAGSQELDKPGALYRSSDNMFGTPEEDAGRRDFTVNALFYDVSNSEIVDYTGGLADLSRGLLRSIGDPNIRFREDPVRMLRAIRFSSKLGFKIHSESARAIARHCKEISLASPPRLFDEVMRLFSFSHTEEAFRRLWESKLMGELLPAVGECLKHTGGKKAPLWKYLSAFDEMTQNLETDKRSPLYVFENALRMAVLLMPQYMNACAHLRPDVSDDVFYNTASYIVDDTFVNQFSSKSWRIPKLLAYSTSELLFRHDKYKQDQKRKRKIFAGRLYPTLSVFWRICARAKGDSAAEDAIRRWDDAFAEYLSARQVDREENERRNSELDIFPHPRLRENGTGNITADAADESGAADPNRQKKKRCRKNKKTEDAAAALAQAADIRPGPAAAGGIIPEAPAADLTGTVSSENRTTEAVQPAENAGNDIPAEHGETTA